MIPHPPPYERVERVVVFDLDDTLYLERDYVLSGFRAVGAWAEQRFKIADFAARATALFDAGHRGDVFDRAFADLGVRTTPELIGQAVSVYRKHWPQISLAQDAAALLAGDRPDGLRLALVTDGFLVAQQQKLRALGLASHGFWPMICTDLWGRAYWKPHPRAFECIEALFGLPARCLTYIGDNPTKDFVTPRRRGWRTIRVDRPQRVNIAEAMHLSGESDLTIVDLSRLDWTNICAEG
ncbi:HAD family hydrolase [Sphingomonas cavernae]|uniref:HAD family hydrolase n=1 Tax=Sphingomonas cavernae TaxID=2320861 RepID=A0A418WQV0_9SPHN|nr:HAD family hydrolase [Sphingomonas cavernae]RJF93640.1 HAD family hydrolase [Sphingomonas cavernae]